MANFVIVELQRNSTKWDKTVEEIVRIEKKIFPKHESLARSFDEELKKRNSGLLYAQVDGDVAGYVMYSWPTSLFASVSKLAVKENNRRRGLGEALLKAAIEKCKTRNIQRISLHVDPERIAAINLYKKLGFQVDTLIEGYYSHDRNAYRMYIDFCKDKKMFDFGYKFPCLEELIIRSCEHLQNIKISSQTLKNLELECCYLVNSLKQLNVDAPNLVGFQYCGVSVPVNVFFTGASGHCWVSVIEINSSETREIFWFLLKKFLSKLSRSEIYLRIRFISDVTFNLEVEERNGIQLVELDPYQVQELIIKCEQSCQVETALEGIFWVCHPKTIKQFLLGFLDIVYMDILIN